jgi:hypothetical protein
MTDPPCDTAQNRCQRQEHEEREDDERNEHPADQWSDSVNVRGHPDRRQPDDKPWHRGGGKEDEYPGARPACDPRPGAKTKYAVRRGAAQTEEQKRCSDDSDPDDWQQRCHDTAVSSSVVFRLAGSSIPSAYFREPDPVYFSR